MKRILLLLIALVMTAIAAASFAVRQAPEWLRAALETHMGKTVSIRTIDFQFPNLFILSGVKITEKDGPFAGEPEFEAETVRLTALPTALRQNPIVVDSIDVRDASVTLRQSKHRRYHVFSKAYLSDASGEVFSGTKKSGAEGRRLLVRSIHLDGGRVQFLDYDAGPQGFAFEMDEVEARLSGLSIPASREKVTTTLEGRLLQGREEKPAAFRISGWWTASPLDLQMNGAINDLHLTYFLPYLSRITPAVLREGYADIQVRMQTVGEGELAVDADLALNSLYFQSLEGENQLFGLSAAEILDFLKDSSGRLRVPLSFRWKYGDRSVRLRDAVRQSIEKSLRVTVFGNMGALLEKVIGKIGEKGLEAPQQSTETVLKKIKDFLKY